MGSGAELNAILFASSGAEVIPDQTSLLGTIKLTDNGLTQDRQVCAITEIASGLENKRDYGVDIPHVVLGAKPYIDPSKSGSLYQSVRNITEAEIAYKNTLHNWKLNEEQLYSANRTFRSEEGLSVVYGPPGSGKTHTTMAIGNGLVNAGKAASRKLQVMVCAGSNVATEHAMETLLRHTGSGSDLSICAFGASQSPDEVGDDRALVARVLHAALEVHRQVPG
jgi:hypothetical protein